GDHTNITLPRWSAADGAFLSGKKTIREEFLRIVEGYGALAPSSAAADAADATDMPAVDIRGLPRDPMPDLGAYELGPTQPGAGGSTGRGSSSSGAGPASGSGGAGAGSSAAGAALTEPGDDGGCGCRVGPGADPEDGRIHPAALLALAAGLLVRFRESTRC